MLLFGKGSVDTNLSRDDLRVGLFEALDKLGPRKKVVAVPPDITRYHSQAGILTEFVSEYYQEKLTDVLPSIGTHSPMSEQEIGSMYGRVPRNLFRAHNWRSGFLTLGDVPSDLVKQVSGGAVDYSIPIQIGKLLVEGGHDLILSIGQVVPHEVVGMANHNKNLFIGTGGREGINKTHFLGAAYGLERIMGRADTPVKRVLNYGSEHFAKDMPIVYVLTVVDKVEDSASEHGTSQLAVKGLFIGDDIECFNLAAALSLKVNFFMLDEQLKKVVVYLDPKEFKSTWLGNKSIYRTRMAIADGGELIVLAPGLREFGEDPGNDKIIRKYGYIGTDKILNLAESNGDLKDNLGAAAHLIHGSSEGRFSITYCPGYLTKEEVEGVNFRYANIDRVIKRYDPNKLADGFNKLPGGEEVFYISNPALGLWAHKARFDKI
jgi:nickel-dependent lactate racemase